MSDYRDPNFHYRNPEDRLQRDIRFDPDARAANAVWGCIAAAVFLVVVLAVAFGIGHQPGQLGTNTASHDATAPLAMSRMNPLPSSSAPATPAPPITPAPNTLAQRGSSQ